MVAVPNGEDDCGSMRFGPADTRVADSTQGAPRQCLTIQAFQHSCSGLRFALDGADTPIPDEEVFTSPPYLCIEIMSPDDTMTAMQDRIDNYLAFGVPNVWVIDPSKHGGWRVPEAGWTAAPDRILRTADARIPMPLSEVLLP